MTRVFQILIDSIALGGIYSLTALGIGLIFGILRLINFAHGDFITIGGYSLIVPSLSAVGAPLLGGLPFYLMIPGVICVVVIVALITDRIAFRPLRGASMSTLLVASFAVSYVLQNVTLLLYSGRPKAVDLAYNLSTTINFLGLRIPAIQLVAIAATAVLLGALTFFLHKSRFGIQMRAAAEDFQMARFLGVRANVVIALAFAISGLLAAIVSLIVVTQSGTLNVFMGQSIVMVAFVATVIGGMGSLVGAALGGLLVGIVSGILQAVLPDNLVQMREAFVFACVVLVLLFRPHGLVVVRAVKDRV